MEKAVLHSGFDAPLTPQNMKGREYRISVMRDLVDFVLNVDIALCM